MSHRRFGALAVSLALMVFGAACGSGDAADTAEPEAGGEATGEATEDTAAAEPAVVVPIGHLANLTGAAASLGVPFDQGLRLALEDIEAAGYLSDVGAGLELLTEDTGSEPTNAVTLFNEFVDQDVPVAVSDGISPIALAVGPVANDEEVAFMTGAGSGTPEEDFEFHMSDITTQYQEIAGYLVDNGGPRVAAIVAADNPAFPFLTDQLEAGLEEVGGEIVHRESIEGDTSDFSSALTNVAETDPDVVFLSTLADQGGNIIAQMQQVGGFDDVLVSIQSGVDRTVAEIAGSAAEGVVLRPAWAPGTPGSEEFDQAYRDAYGEAAAPQASLGYQSGWIIAAAVKMALEDGEEVTGEALRSRIPAASTSADVQENGIIPDFEIHADGSTTWPGVLSTFDSEGDIVALEE